MSRRHPDSLIFDTIRLEGSLFVPALLENAARGDHSEQAPADYQLPKGLSLADEQGRAFRIAGALWKNFDPVRARKDVDALKATIGFASELLRDALDYSDFTFCPTPVEIQGRHFPITALSRSRVPVIVAPHDLDLDTPDERLAVIGSGTRRKSAYQLAQQFLNASADCTWALVTNGRQIRLVRDSDTLTRPAYLEFDLELILANDRYADFAALWRIVHSSRAGTSGTDGEDCVWERWKREGEAQGERVRAGLRIGVQDALLALGTGFLKANGNDELRCRIESGELTKDAYFQQLLRLVYRFLFLFTVEERGLLHAPDDSAEAREARNIYVKGYALRRLRDRSLRRAGFDRFTDLWEGIKIVFRGLANGESRLALPALGGLFAATQCPDLDSAALENRALLTTMRHLRWSSGSGTLAAVDYRNMGPEELGSVYESLLELIPTVDLPSRTFGFIGITDDGSTAGNTRKTTGSYYTPDSLVQELIKSALNPVIAQKITDRPDDPTTALLSISVIDPACGSGHFLIAAARRLAEKLAELRAPAGAVTPADYRHALREVISHCIYGVDRNPMALELARTALWLEGYDPGQPLSFLDHHLQCGDALLGVTSFAQLRKGIAKDAFTVLSGDDRKVCKNLAATNREALKSLKERLADKSAELFDVCDINDVLNRLEAIEAMPDDSTEQVDFKKTAYTHFLVDAQASPLAHACDSFIAAYLTPKTPENENICPTTGTLLALFYPDQGYRDPSASISAANDRCRDARVFHWPLRFAHIFGHGGFDCVLGNPPWERIKLQEQEFFAAREPAIAAAKNKAERAKRIQWLSEGSLHHHLSQFEATSPPDRNEISLFREFENEKRISEATSSFAHVAGEDGGRFELTGVGDVNTYALFAETIEQIRADSGRAGFIVPTGIATDDSTKAYFAHIAEGGRLARLIDFENREKVFPAIDSRIKFSLLTLGRTNSAIFSFFLTQTDQLADKRRSFTLSLEDFRLINPNTRTCPIFRTESDADLTKKIHHCVPVLTLEDPSTQFRHNPWGFDYMTKMFDMADSSHEFIDLSDIVASGWNRSGIDFVNANNVQYAPLYEAKHVHHFDHRWGTESNAGEKLKSFRAPELSLTPRYWVSRARVDERLASKQWNKSWLLGWRDITNATNERTCILTVIPRTAVAHTLRVAFVSTPAPQAAAFQACLSSLVLDYVARQKVGGTHLTVELLKQLPVLPPDAYSESDLAFIVPRVLELTFTADDLNGWAMDLGYDGPPFPFDPDRRAIIRAELDAYFAKLYGLTRDELRYILDPATTNGEDYPTETFRGLKANELRKYNEYRTQTFVLEAERSKKSLLEIPPASFRIAHFPGLPDGIRSISEEAEGIWLKFVIQFIRQAHSEATLPLLSQAWHRFCDLSRYQIELEAMLPADNFAKWRQSGPVSHAREGFHEFVSNLVGSQQLEYDDSSLVLSLPDDTLDDIEADPWLRVEVSLTLKLLAQDSSLESWLPQTIGEDPNTRIAFLREFDLVAA